MPRIIKNNFGKVLAVLILLTAVSITLIFSLLKSSSAKAQEQIKIFPTAFSGDWQNPGATFSQDLGERASFEEFNTNNSAYPLEQKQQGEAEPTSFWEKIENFFKEIVFAQEENQEQVLNEEEVAPPEEEPSQELPEEPTIEEPIIEEPVVEEPVIEEEKQPVEKTLELSNLSISEDFSDKIINNVQLRISLAGRGEVGDRLIISYFYQDSWQNLATFDLENEISNSLSGGYFLFALPIFENWTDLENLKIKFTYSGFQNSKIFLDAVWLEVEYEKEEPPQLAQPMGERKDFRADEEPEFIITEEGIRWGNLIKKIKSFFQPELKIYQKTLMAPNGRQGAADLLIEEVGEDFQLKIKKGRNFRPGKYFLNVEIAERGQIYKLEKEFTWGVLAINTNKSIYLPNETAYLQMAALNDQGHTICNANLKLEIISPSGGLSSITVQRSGECGPNNVTDVPDYFAYYQVDGAGIYQVILTNLDTGCQITDSFEVRDSIPFEVERIGPTRIYLFSMYEMKIIVKTNQDFLGEIKEIVPASFEVTPHPSARVERLDDLKEISWQVDWKTRESHELRYSFYVPDISPYLYLLGPLEIADFKEMRFWQIAVDAEPKIPVFALNPLHKCSIHPFSQTVTRGGEINYLISLMPSTSSSPFLLSLGNLPFGVTSTLGESSGIAPLEVTLKFNIHPDAQVGSFSLVVIYQEGEMATFCQLNLIIE